MVRVVLMGAGGRMGRENMAVFCADKDIEIIGAIERKDSKYINMDAGSVAGISSIGVPVSSDLEKVIEKTDVVVDFTSPEATLNTIKIAANHSKAMVIGTTGFSDEQRKIIKKYSKRIPVLLSPNMSQGVNILFHLVKKASELFGKEFDVEILEIHHNRKKDAPSGTALRFGRLIADTRGKKLEDISVFCRKGVNEIRKKDEIGMMSLRLGDEIGEHTIIFGGPGERIEFTHKSCSRRNYASGALKATKFVANQRAGLYGMEDVLGIESC